MTMIYRPKDESKRFYLATIYGDCLERVGLKIPHEAYAVIDKCSDIKVGDLVKCTKVAGTLNSYIKQVKEIKEDSVIVGTAYLDHSKDYEFEAAEIRGVVVAAYCKVYRDLIYERPDPDAVWIPQDETFTKFECSNCHARNHEGIPGYCPTCGHKIRSQIRK